VSNLPCAHRGGHRGGGHVDSMRPIIAAA
jgi:hypothetical protein